MVAASASTVPTLARLLGVGRAVTIWGGFTALVLFGIMFLLRDSLRYLDWTEAAYQRFWSHRTALAAHVLTASLALVVAPLQFSTRFRARWPVAHRRIGWTYVTCALLSAPVAFHLSLFSVCTMCIPPFALWSVLFFLTTALAVLMAVRRRFEAHRQFMIRSWVLMNGFVFVRLDAHFPYPLPTGPDTYRPAMIIWLAWVVPLVVTEIWLTWIPLATRKRGRAGPIQSA